MRKKSIETYLSFIGRLFAPACKISSPNPPIPPLLKGGKRGFKGGIGGDFKKWVGYRACSHRTNMSLLLLLFVAICCPKIAEGYWEWTPKTRKWINPKYAVKATSKEQYEYGMELYNSRDYDRAILEFKKLIKNYPSSEEAPEAQYTIGLIYEDKGEYYEAFKSYQKVIEDYPSTERINEIIGREFKIANLFYEGQRRRVMGILFIPSIDKAIEIFQKVIENAPYGEYADIAQYKIGLCHMKEKNYEEAKAEFEKLINEYPKSSLTDDAKYQIVLASSLISLKAPYDQETTETGIKESEEFKTEYPESELKEDVNGIKAQLKNKEAEKIFNIARFYEKRKKMTSARIYYESIIRDYSETTWAEEAKKRLEIIGGTDGN